MNDTVVATALHRITTVHPGARRVERSLAACPREHGAVDGAVCASCPHARGVIHEAVAREGRSMLCSVERSERVQAEPGSVGSLMRRDVACVLPDVDLDDVVRLLNQRNMGCVPVVDGDDIPIGMLSKTDLVSVYARRRVRGGELLDSFDADVAALPDPVSARDVMSDVVFTLRESESIARAAELFAAKGVHRAPVVRADGRIVGVLTSFDVVRALAGAMAVT